MAVLGATSLSGCNSIPDFIAAGSLVLFQQSTAPLSWTKQTTHDNKALRVVSGTATPGGTTAFTSVFTSRTPTGSVSGSGTIGNTTLTTPQIPSHAHPNGSAYVAVRGISPPTPLDGGAAWNVGGNTTGNNGADGAHSHPFSLDSATFTGNALDFAVQYVDVIICSKD